MIVFQAHQVFPGGLFLNLILCLLPLIVFLILKKLGLLPKIGKQSKIFDLFFIYCFILLLPNALYAFFEIKHVIYSSWTSFFVFGGMSLIGLSCTLIINMLIVDHYAKNKIEMFVYYLILSLICGFGAAVGLLDYTSLVGFKFLTLLGIALELLHLPILFYFSCGVSALIFSLGYLPHRFLFKPSYY